MNKNQLAGMILAFGIVSENIGARLALDIQYSLEWRAVGVALAAIGGACIYEGYQRLALP